MSSRKNGIGRVSGMHMNSIVNDINESRRLCQYFSSIQVGKIMYIPTDVADFDDDKKSRKPKQKMKVRFRVVGKTNRMLVCERDNGTRECFNFCDLAILQKQYGGLIDGKSE